MCRRIEIWVYVLRVSGNGINLMFQFEEKPHLRARASRSIILIFDTPSVQVHISSKPIPQRRGIIDALAGET